MTQRRPLSFRFSISLLILASLLPSITADDALLDKCLADPSPRACRDVRLPDDRVYRDLDSLCSMMNFMSGCTIHKLCNSSEAQAVFPELCEPISALATVCLKDMPRMRGCSDFNALCSSNSSVLQCYDAIAIASRVPTTVEARDGIWSICQEMDMEGCDKCPKKPGKSFPDCDILTTYSELCWDMPEMSQCSEFGWKAMCRGHEFARTSLCGDGDTGDQVRGPAMKMFFHFGITEYILFRNWVPRTGLQYASTLALVFLASLIFQLADISASNAMLTYLRPGIALADEDTPLPAPSGRANLVRAAMVAFMKLYGFALMLLVMSFNVGIILAVVLGMGVGEYFFGYWRRPEAAWEGEGKCC